MITKVKTSFSLYLILSTFFLVLTSVILWQISLLKKLSLQNNLENLCSKSLEKEISEMRNYNYSQVILRPRIIEYEKNSALVCFPHISEFVSKHKGKILEINIHRNGVLLQKDTKNKTFFIDSNLPQKGIDYVLTYSFGNGRTFVSEPEVFRVTEPLNVELIYEIPLPQLLMQKLKLSDNKEEEIAIRMIQKTLEQLEYAVLMDFIEKRRVENVQLILKEKGHEVVINLEDGNTYRQEALDGPYVHLRFGSPYSGHGFFWDEATVTWYFLKLFPEISTSTLDFWYRLQIEEGINKGLIPREIRVESTPLFVKNNNLLQENVNPISYIPLTSLQINNPFFLSKIELEYYSLYKDLKRLKKVYPKLESYFYWVEKNRKKFDESTRCPYYEFSNLGSGMDNIMRGYGLFNPTLEKYGWVDLFAQQVILAQDLEKIQKIIKHIPSQEIQSMSILNDFISCHRDPEDELFWDRDYQTGLIKKPQTVASFWALLIDFGDQNTTFKKPLIDLLADPQKFAGYPLIPSVARDDQLFSSDGNYWQGGVWPPINWLIIKALEFSGYQDLKNDITHQTVTLIIDVFEKTGTVFEYYSPTHTGPGVYNGVEARKEFYGWGALGVPLILE